MKNVWVFKIMLTKTDEFHEIIKPNQSYGKELMTASEIQKKNKCNRQFKKYIRRKKILYTITKAKNDFKLHI